METEDSPKTTWDQLLGRAAESLCQTGTTNRRLRALPQPKRQFHQQAVRSISAVDADLLDVFRRLAYGEARWPLFLHGDVGTGKTCAALALSDMVEANWFGTVERACDAVMGRAEKTWLYDYSPRPNDTAALVVLDEIGARQKCGDLEYTTVKEFADNREFYHGRVAIYISNLNPDAVAGVYDDRVASRLLCGTWFQLDGKDRRMAT